MTKNPQNAVRISMVKTSSLTSFSFTCAEHEADESAFVEVVRAFQRGKELENALLPEIMWPWHRNDSRKKTLPSMFIAGGFLAVSSDLADILREFDLGPTKFFPVRFLRMDKKTPYPGDHFLLQILAQKEGFEPQYSKRFRKKMYEHQTFWGALPHGAQDDDVSMNSTVLQEPDFWVDPRLLSSVVFSDGLMAAIRAAKLAGRAPILRAPVVFEQ